jgi:hypothetical protein
VLVLGVGELWCGSGWRGALAVAHVVLNDWSHGAGLGGSARANLEFLATLLAHHVLPSRTLAVNSQEGQKLNPTLRGHPGDVYS